MIENDGSLAAELQEAFQSTRTLLGDHYEAGRTRICRWVTASGALSDLAKKQGLGDVQLNIRPLILCASSAEMAWNWVSISNPNDAVHKGDHTWPIRELVKNASVDVRRCAELTKDELRTSAAMLANLPITDALREGLSGHKGDAPKKLV
jgi:hypothetical protein